MVNDWKQDDEEVNANGIRAKMSEIIFDEFQRLIKVQVEPWIFFRTGKFHVKKFDGNDISYSGNIEFEDFPQQIFWSGYIQPFLKDIIKKKIDETIKLAKEKNVRISYVLYSTKNNLSGGIDSVFRKMQEVERRIRGKGQPKSVGKRNIEVEIKEMSNFLDKQIKTFENLSFQTPDSWFKKWYQKNPHVIWLISIIFSFIAFLISVIALFIK